MGRKSLIGLSLAALILVVVRPGVLAETAGVTGSHGQGVFLSADVTGDGVADIVTLTGRGYEAGSSFAREHDLVVTDGATGNKTTVPLNPQNGGYEGTMFLGDVNGDKVADILVGLPTGGSGGLVNYYLVSMTGGKPVFLVDPVALSRDPHFQVTFQNGFKVKVEDETLHQSFILALAGVTGSDTSRWEVYRNLYSASGELLRPETGVADWYGLLVPRDPDNDGTYELAGYQQIWGLFHANTIGTARSVWRWTDGALKVVEVDVNSAL